MTSYKYWRHKYCHNIIIITSWCLCTDLVGVSMLYVRTLCRSWISSIFLRLRLISSSNVSFFVTESLKMMRKYYDISTTIEHMFLLMNIWPFWNKDLWIKDSHFTDGWLRTQGFVDWSFIHLFEGIHHLLPTNIIELLGVFINMPFIPYVSSAFFITTWDFIFYCYI